MSLLDSWNTEVVLFPEEVVVDEDGNTRTQASKVGIPLRVTLQPWGQSGTSARKREQDLEGFMTEKVYRMRLRREDSHIVIGAQSKVLVGDKLFSVFGDATWYMGSPRTRHVDYALWRS